MREGGGVRDEREGMREGSRFGWREGKGKKAIVDGLRGKGGIIMDG